MIESEKILPIQIYAFLENFRLCRVGKKPFDTPDITYKFEYILKKLARLNVMKIHNDIKCGHYDFRDVMAITYDFYIHNPKGNLLFQKRLFDKASSAHKRFFNASIVKHETEKLTEIVADQKEFDDIDSIFEIDKHTHESIAHMLLMKRIISPITYLTYMDETNTSKKSKSQQQLDDVMSLIKDTL